MKSVLPVFWTLFLVTTKLLCQTTTFDNLNANALTNKAITWLSSNWGNGFGHRIINSDPGGYTLLNFQSRHNTTTWSNSISLTSDGKVGVGTTTPYDKLEVRDGRIRISRGNDRMFLSVDDVNSKSQISFGDDLNDRLAFYFDFWQGTAQDKEVMSVHANGRVGIGTNLSTPDAKLTVKGDIHAEEVKVDLNVPGPDYVFKEGYDLKTLEEVQNHIETKGHLPNIPSAAEMEANGIELGEMNMKLLKKIEELMLYTLQQQEQIDRLKLIEKRLRTLEKLLLSNTDTNLER
ncbi:hypothetical protein [uncultured Croceitalea sp.]|uniref:hypothetical protein n=1 Tax=uncultured Croceitalea sp. TaxID=1798908 RepID=UPI0033068E0B